MSRPGEQGRKYHFGQMRGKIISWSLDAVASVGAIAHLITAHVLCALFVVFKRELIPSRLLIEIYFDTLRRSFH